MGPHTPPHGIDRQDPPAIRFASDIRQTRTGSRKIPIGLERLSDGADVYRIMCGIQTRDRAGTDPGRQSGPGGQLWAPAAAPGETP